MVDLVTPGPGAYQLTEPSGALSNVNSFFKSRSTRHTYASALHSAELPSSADHGRLRDWVKHRPWGSTHHPKRARHGPRVSKYANFLDERGRLVYRPDAPGGPEAVGPGSYDDMTRPPSRISQINCVDRPSPYGAANGVPSPDAYVIATTDARLLPRISDKYPTPRPLEVHDTMIGAARRRIPKRPNAVFQTSVPRQPFGADGELVPGPGTYESRDPFAEIPHFTPGSSFGTRAARVIRHEITPGPSDYPAAFPRPTPARAGTSNFLSRTVRPTPEPPTPAVVGPGTYEARGRRTCPRKSPPFADRSDRAWSGEFVTPSPVDYQPGADRTKPALVLATRYPVHDDWVATLINDAPSPENYTIDRSLSKRPSTFPTTDTLKKAPMQKVGPGSYETATSSVIKKSFNVAVPPEISALG
jgi:hypothetical protein